MLTIVRTLRKSSECNWSINMPQSKHYREDFTAGSSGVNSGSKGVKINS